MKPSLAAFLLAFSIRYCTRGRCRVTWNDGRALVSALSLWRLPCHRTTNRTALRRAKRRCMVPRWRGFCGGAFPQTAPRHRSPSSSTALLSYPGRLRCDVFHQAWAFAEGCLPLITASKLNLQSKTNIRFKPVGLYKYGTLVFPYLGSANTKTTFHLLFWSFIYCTGLKQTGRNPHSNVHPATSGSLHFMPFSATFDVNARTTRSSVVILKELTLAMQACEKLHVCHVTRTMTV